MKRKVRTKKATAVLLSVVFATVTLLSGAMMLFGFAAPTYMDTYTVDATTPRQEFDGWGLSLSWWATEIGDWTRQGSSGMTKREELMEAIYGKSGLNLNIARYNVGGGDDPTHTHMTDDRNTPGWRGATTNADGTYTPDTRYVYTTADGRTLSWEQTPDWRQLWVLDWIQKNRDGVITEYYNNSPPYWLTKSGCSSGSVKDKAHENDKEGLGDNYGYNWNLENDYAHNQAFVEYFLDVYEYLTAQGFTFENLQPFNESGPNYWYWAANGDQEGCHFSAQQQIEILHLLDLEMQKRGIKAEYNYGDETNTNRATHTYNLGRAAKTSDNVSGANVIDGAGRLTYHIYSRDENQMKQMYLNAKTHHQEVYMSEVSYKGNGDAYDPNNMEAGFEYTNGIIATVQRGGVDGYVFWQGVEDMVGQMKSSTNWGLIQGVYYTQEEAESQGVDLAAMGMTYQDYVLSKSYYMSGQFTKYVQPGYTILNNSDSSNTLSALSPDGKTLVIVKQNNSSGGAAVKYDLNGFKATSVEKIYTDKTHNWATAEISTDGKSIVDTVSPSSITTYVLHADYAAGTGHFVDDSQTVGDQDIEDIYEAFEINGNVEQLYSTFKIDNGGGNATYYQTNYSRKSGDYFAFRFYGVGFDLLCPTKNDSGKITVWIDEKPVASSTKDGEKDLYTEKAVATSKVYSKTGLEQGWHTVYVKVEKGVGNVYVNFDGIIVHETESQIPENENLAITESAGVDGTVYFAFESEGYDDYTHYAEYRAAGAKEWTRTSELTVNEGKGTGTIAIADATVKTVQLRIVAGKDGQEKVSTPQAVSMMTRTAGVLYFVNCGSATPYALSAGAVLGSCQGATNQSHGADFVTGITWGHTNTSKGGGTGFNETSDAMTAMMHKDKINLVSGKIQYKFTIPEAGTDYKVAVGFYGGGAGWGSRDVKVSVTGATEQTLTLNAGNYTAAYFTVSTTSANSVLTVDVTGDMVSTIVITDTSHKVPLYTSVASTYNSESTVKAGEIDLGTDAVDYIQKNAKATLYFSDGSNKEIKATDANVTCTVQAAATVKKAIGIAAGKTITAQMTTSEYSGLTISAPYTWKQEGSSVLYYFIDCGFTGTGTDSDRATVPPEDTAGNIGSKQSTTHDRAYGEDSTGNSWGYDSKYPGNLNWTDNKSADWSIRGDAGNNLTYTMTGFKESEALTIEVSGHLAKGWGARKFNVNCNGSDVGVVELPDPNTKDGDTFGKGTFECTADGNGKLVVKFTINEGSDPHVSYIKVSSSGTKFAAANTITASSKTVARGGKVTLGNLDTNATVYIVDENDTVLGSFVPTAATKEITVADYLTASSNVLRVVQAVKGNGGTIDNRSLSEECVISVLGVDCTVSKDYVRDGGASVIKVLPHAEYGVTSLTITKPDTVVVDLSNSFYYRAKENGKYTITLVSDGVTVTKEIVIDKIDTVSFGAELSTSNWTDQDVTITLAPTAASGIEKVLVNDVEVTLENDSYEFVAQENGTYTVKIVTSAGYTYEKEFTVSNIDKSAPSVTMQLQYSAAGLSLGYAIDSLSGGKLMVAYNNGEAAEVTDTEALLFDKAGKYEIYFTNGVGESSQAKVYHMTYGEANAVLGTVSVAADGTVTAPTGAKLYRAGEKTALTTLKAEQAGRYYLQLEKDGETEVVVLNIASTATGEIIDVTPPAKEKGDGNMGLMIAGLIIGLAALLAAAVVCPLLIVKGRKNA